MLIVGGNQSAGGYNVDNSCRFNQASQDYLNKTFSSDTNRTTYTISTWVKRSSVADETFIIAADTSAGGGNTRDFVRIESNDQLRYTIGGGAAADVKTTQVLRDVSAWYHIVIAMDTTQATASNRTKVYINNTLYNLTTLFNQNEDTPVNSTLIHAVGVGTDNLTANHFNGSMSHVNFIDGTAYDATAFGEYDANGVWKIKTSPSVTYGTNGFFILKDGNSVTDQSPNTNNFTVAGGTLTKTEDNPSNVFAVLNTLDKNISNITLSNGNLTMTTSAINYGVRATMGVSSGKWYWEVKVVNKATLPSFGIAKSDWDLRYPGNTSTSIGYASNGEIYSAGNNEGAYGAAYTTGDIIGVALDMDSLTLTFYKNGVSQGAVSSVFTASDFIFPAFAGQTSDVLSINFGNGYFGTTAVASAGTNASGNGIFEFDVPTGYTALSTKGYNL